MDSEALALEKETSFRLKPDLFAQKLEGGAPSPPPNLELLQQQAIDRSRGRQLLALLY